MRCNMRMLVAVALLIATLIHPGHTGITEHQIYSSLRDRLSDAGHHPAVLDAKTRQLRHNDTSFYSSQVCRGCFHVLDLENGTDLQQFREVPDRTSTWIKLPFEYVFFGRLLERILVSTEGFVSVGDRLHDQIHLVEYIAVLKADFYVSPESSIRTLNTTYEQVVEWRDVVLQNDRGAKFRLQIVLSANGTVTLNYISVPDGFRDKIQGVADNEVLAGLSDSLRTHGAIVEFQKLSVDLSVIQNGTQVRYLPFSPCHQSRSCRLCLEHRHCRWCPSSDQCFAAGDPVDQECVASSFDAYCGPPKEASVHTEHYNVTWDSAKLPKAALRSLVPTETPLDLNFTFPFFNVDCQQIKVSHSSVTLLQKWDEAWAGPYVELTIRPLGVPVETLSVSSWAVPGGMALDWFVQDGGQNYTFQVVLNRSGDVDFYYEWVPEKLVSEDDVEAVGLFAVLNYDYHAVDLTQWASFIRNGTAAHFSFNFNCSSKTSCKDCTAFSTLCSWTQDRCVNASRAAAVVVSDPCRPPETQDGPPPDVSFYSYQIFRDNASVPWIQDLDRKLMFDLGFSDLNLPFDFLFYGNAVRHLSVSPHGYISVPSTEKIRSKHTQLVAPLQHVFTLDGAPDAGVYVSVGDDRVAVEWRRVKATDTASLLTFQAVLWADGRVVFSYRDLPHDLRFLRKVTMTVGISDGYLTDPHSSREWSTAGNFKTYHRLDLTSHLQPNTVAVELRPKQTCAQFGSCLECTTHQTGFNCNWCPSVRRCIDARRRNRHQEELNGCVLPGRSYINSEQCHPTIHRSNHRFYNQTFLYQPHRTRTPNNEEEPWPVTFDPAFPKMQRIRLPFTFTFYGMDFEEVAASSRGFLTFLPLHPDVTTAIDVFRCYRCPVHVPLVSARYLSGQGVVVKWDDKFQVTLKRSGAIVMDYFGLNDDDVRDYRLHAVGISFTAKDLTLSANFGREYTYSVDWATEHIRNGLTIRLDPYSSCTQLYPNCTSCMAHRQDGDCFWCHSKNKCLETHLTCDFKIKNPDSSEHCSLSEPRTAPNRRWQPSSLPGHIAVGIALLGLLVAIASCVVYHGYKHPTSYPGQFIVRLRMTRYRLMNELDAEDSQIPLHD